jgi:hypothetical protein
MSLKKKALEFFDDHVVVSDASIRRYLARQQIAIDKKAKEYRDSNQDQTTTQKIVEFIDDNFVMSQASSERKLARHQLEVDKKKEAYLEECRNSPGYKLATIIEDWANGRGSQTISINGMTITHNDQTKK